jgi:hypothetical protein
LLKKKIFEISKVADCNEPENKISINDLAGLWIILGSTILLSLLIFLLKKLELVKFPTNYMSPYYNYYSEKTEIFENQLKEAVEFEVSSKFELINKLPSSILFKF